MANDIKILATVKFTDARTISNEGASFIFLSFFWYSVSSNLFEMLFFNTLGVIFSKALLMSTAALTSVLDNMLDPKRSLPDPWRLKLTSVSVTFLALRDNHKVITITIPAINRIKVFAFDLPVNATISSPSGSVPGSAINVWNDFKPANGTPIKFTRSLPANAMARAKVPTSTIIFNISSLIIQYNN